MISILINTFNDQSDWLKQTIKSYIQQDIEKQVLICCLPSDSNIEMLKNYPIELVLCNENEHPGKSIEGVYYQINKAIEKVKGDWFCLMSGNDFSDATKLFTERECCQDKNKLICYSDFFEVDEWGNIKGVRKFPPYDYEKHLTLGNFVSDAAMIHTSLLKKYAPFRVEEFGNYAHWDFWLRIYEGEGNVFHHNQLPTWFYRQHKSASHMNRTPEEKEKLQLLKEKMLCREKK